MRQNFTNSLEKHLTSLFSEKTSSEQGVLGKHPGTDPTPLRFWGRSQAPDFWAAPGSWFLSSGQKSIGSSQRERLSSSREQTQTSCTSSWAYVWVSEPPASSVPAKQLWHHHPFDGGGLIAVCVWLLGPHGLKLARLLCPWNSAGKNTGASCHSLLQGMFPTQGSNSALLHCKRILTEPLGKADTWRNWWSPHRPSACLHRAPQTNLPGRMFVLETYLGSW